LREAREVLIASLPALVDPQHHRRALVVGGQYGLPAVRPVAADFLDEPGRMAEAGRGTGGDGRLSARFLPQIGTQAGVEKIFRPDFFQCCGRFHRLGHRRMSGHAHMPQLIQSYQKQ
jgi:hypothetical protein